MPFSEKDSAKTKGALWDAIQKTWFIPDHKPINDFKQWIDTDNIEIIIKAPFYLALNDKNCWRCDSITKVISLYSDHFYFLDNENEETDNEFFYRAEYKSFFSNITFLDKDIQKFLNQNFPFFKLGFSKTIGEKYWASHCNKCNALQGDFFNHSEPGGAFFPVTMEDYEKLSLIKLPFQFDIGIKGSSSYISNQDEIYEFAKKKIWGE